MTKLGSMLARLASVVVVSSIGLDGASAPIVPAFTNMPPVLNPDNIYSEIGADRLSQAVKGALERVYVPEHGDDSVAVIDPATNTVVTRFDVGRGPQHVVPAWDLKTLWVANNANRRRDGSLTPIDPLTSKPGKTIPVADPYNLYFMPDGSAAIVVAEAFHRLDFRDPQTMEYKASLEVPGCSGINHADFTIDGRFAIFSCEFSAAIAKIDLVNRTVVGILQLSKQGSLAREAAAMPDMPDMQNAVPFIANQTLEFGRRRLGHGLGRGGRRQHGGRRAMRMTHGMPQDIRSSPDGKVFFVADMVSDGVYMIDPAAFTEIGFIPTGIGAHGFTVSRDGKKLYVSNRGSHAMPNGAPGGQGSVSVIDFATRNVEVTWPIPGGGSPDMGNVSADGKSLWFSGRFDNEVYRIDTLTGVVIKIKVGVAPHGLTVWPQPGRYSLGHTGNLR